MRLHNIALLYQFTITDEFGTPPVELYLHAEDICKEESIEQEWNCEYTFVQTAPPEQLLDGRVRYFFSVFNVGDKE